MRCLFSDEMVFSISSIFVLGVNRKCYPSSHELLNTSLIPPHDGVSHASVNFGIFSSLCWNGGPSSELSCLVSCTTGFLALMSCARVQPHSAFLTLMFVLCSFYSSVTPSEHVIFLNGVQFVEH